MSKVLITTVPFGEKNRLPLDLLEKSNIEYLINPLNKKLTEDELLELVDDFDAIIAGTEKISKKVINKAKNLKHISRVGIGLDSVDLIAAENNDIIVSYTPDAPAPAVAELTIGLMLSLLRSTHIANKKLHNAEWKRYFGRRISNTTVGIIGLGRIGKGVTEHLLSLGVKNILFNDINLNPQNINLPIQSVTKEEIYKEADIISLHLPLTNLTKDLVKKDQLLSMKNDAVILNTSRGGIINENDLYDVLKSGHLSGAAIDVFENEPYNGPLKDIDNCLLTAHMGSMSVDCRTRMEIEATEEAIRFLQGKHLEGIVPKEEYDAQKLGL